LWQKQQRLRNDLQQPAGATHEQGIPLLRCRPGSCHVRDCPCDRAISTTSPTSNATGGSSARLRPTERQEGSCAQTHQSPEIGAVNSPRSAAKRPISSNSSLAPGGAETTYPDLDCTGTLTRVGEAERESSPCRQRGGSLGSDSLARAMTAPRPWGDPRRANLALERETRAVWPSECDRSASCSTTSIRRLGSPTCSPVYRIIPPSASTSFCPGIGTRGASQLKPLDRVLRLPTRGSSPDGYGATNGLRTGAVLAQQEILHNA
jgi:hypothetical protein